MTQWFGIACWKKLLLAFLMQSVSLAVDVLNLLTKNDICSEVTVSNNGELDDFLPSRATSSLKIQFLQ